MDASSPESTNKIHIGLAFYARDLYFASVLVKKIGIINSKIRRRFKYIFQIFVG
jgi:hypothetical protein